MIPAAEVFMHCANTVAAQYAKVPPFATYDVHTKLHMLKKDDAFDRRVSVRTADQVAVVFDDRTKKEKLDAPFPAPPNLDPLAHFKLMGAFILKIGGGSGPHRDLAFSVSNVDPLTYETTIKSDANVVARAVRGYSVAVVDDAGERLTHLHLIAGPSVRGADSSSAWFRDVYIDKATDLPIRVVYENSFGTMTADYETVQGYWLLKSFTIHWELVAPLHIGQSTFAFESTFDNYAFSETAPDPRLVPGALPTPAPAPTKASARTADQVAIVYDFRTDKDVVRAPFPAPPNIDLLGTFAYDGVFQYRSKGRFTDVDLRFSNVEPLKYEAAVERDNGVVARALKSYAIAVVDDAGERLTHLKFSPGSAALAQKTWFEDVYIDKATDLPVRILKGEEYGTIAADYQTIQGHWLLKSFAMNNVWHPFGISAIAGHLEPTVDDYTFGDTAPDPRLVPVPVPAASSV